MSFFEVLHPAFLLKAVLIQYWYVLVYVCLCVSWNWAVSCHSCPCYHAGIQRNHRKLKCPPFSSLCSSSFASPRSTAVQVLLRVWRICWLLARQGPQYFPRKQWRAHCANFIWPFRHFQTLWAIRRAFLCSLPSQEWQCGGVPVTSLCVIERRKGKARVIETLSWFVLICAVRGSKVGLILSQIQKLCVYRSNGVPEQDKPVIRKALVEMTGDLSGS